ncbi:MAG: PKD domain-containing protein [Planctomycetota bacterium]
MIPRLLNSCSKKIAMHRSLSLGILGTVLTTGCALAQFSVVLPNGYAAATANTANAFPWASISTAFPGLRIQTVYDGGDFTAQSVTYPILITGLRWRTADNSSATWTGGTYNNITVSVSTAAVNYLATTTNYATNHGGDLTVVHTGPVTVQAGTGNGAGQPGPWYVDIQFGSPFLYDPSLGDLAVEVDNPSPSTNWTGGSQSTVTTVSTPVPAAKRVYGSTLYPNANGVDGNILVMEVQYTPAAGLYSAFSALPTSGPVGMTVNFTDHTYTNDPGGVLTWAWDLNGDGITDSTIQNPTFTYNTCGSYNVTLTTTDASHPASTLTRNSYIQVGISTIAPSFSWSSIGPDTYQFTDTSTPAAASWAWDFDGDSVIDSTLQNPVWNAPPCTTRTNCTLTVTNTCNIPYSTTRALELIAPVTPTFTYSALAPGVYQFTDTTSPTPTAWAWDFDGDGIADSTSQNPVWAYASGCIAANVRLQVWVNCYGPWASSQPLLASPLTATATPFTGGNGTTGGPVGNMFDVTVTNPHGITICGLTQGIYTYVGPFTAEVYVTNDTYLGKEATAGAWRRVATGGGSCATAGALSPATGYTIALNENVYLPPGNYGIAIYLYQPAGAMYVCYTNGPLGPYANGDITFFPNPTTAPGRSNVGLFTGSGFTPRCWNGTFHYSTFANGDDAGYGFFGPGCPGSLGTSRLTANSQPVIGTQMSVTVNNLPLNVAIMLTGLSKTNWLLGALPFDLAVYGAPGCNLRVSPDANLLLLGAGGSAVWPFTIPSNAGLIGVNLYNQAVVLSPGTNAAGAVGSDAAGMMVGL